MIYLPKVYGTCMGAYKAVNTAFSINKDNVVVYKEILHNQSVMEMLKKKNIKCVENIEDINKNNEVVIRAHGEGKSTYDYFDKKKIKYYDATCINVKKIHDMVYKKYLDNYQIIIVGKKSHPEVLGTNGWCNNEAIIITNIDEVNDLNILNDKIFVVAQTTISESKYLDIVSKLKEKYNIEYENTICNAQKLIQTSALELAKDMDIMIVIGGKNSSNTKELYNVCNDKCTSYLVSNISEFLALIKKLDINNDTKIGFTGGASTMKEEVLNYKNVLEFYIYYKDIKNKYIEEMNKYNSTFISSDNEIITDSINKFIDMNSGGKYIRATLIDLGYKISGNNDYYAIPLGVAYETFQTAILVHDDIIDNASLRRDKVTIPYKYISELKSTKYKDKVTEAANSLGICLGDLGFFYANKIIMDNYSLDKNITKLLSYYNNIVISTIKGEILDVMLPLKAECFKYNTKDADVMEIYDLKTAWYTIIGPFSLGLILGGNEELIPSFYEVLRKIGVAFQIQDDILGIYSDTGVIGKDSSDISEFKQTILYSHLNKKYKKELLEYYGKTNLTKKDILKVQDIFTKSGSLAYANNLMDNLYNESKNEIDKLNIDSNIKNILKGFIIYLESRKK